MFKFRTFGATCSFVNRATMLLYIVLGDDGLFWVCSPRQARELEKKGYEILD